MVPTIDERLSPAPQEPGLVPSALRGRRLLIVANDAQLRRSHSAHFACEGAVVHDVGSVFHANTALAREPWDVVLVDAQLPDGDGIRDLVLQPGVTDPAWVATCGPIDAECQLQVYAAGGIVLTRPVALETLRSAVELTVRRIDESRVRRAQLAPSWLDPAELRIVRASGTVQLMRGEYDVLLYLARRKQRWVHTIDIAKQVFARQDRAAQLLVRQYVFRLRRKLTALPDITIEHSRRLGYRVCVDDDERAMAPG